MREPKAGPHLAVDNFVQSPYSSQGYNRYSYVHNSPLSYADPTGELLIPYPIAAYEANSWDPYGWGKGEKFDGTVVAGISPDGVGVNVYGGGSLSSGSPNWIVGGNKQTGNAGGGVSSFGLPSYTQAPSAMSIQMPYWLSHPGEYKSEFNPFADEVDWMYVTADGSGVGGDPEGDPPGTSWIKNVGTAFGMTGIWMTGIHFGADWVFVNNRVTEAMKNSKGINIARENYYKHGTKFNNYHFGFPDGIIDGGFDSIEQFVWSYDYTIQRQGDILIYTVVNTTSFASFLFNAWPYEWNWESGPGSNFTQYYIFTEPVRK